MDAPKPLKQQSSLHQANIDFLAELGKKKELNPDIRIKSTADGSLFSAEPMVVTPKLEFYGWSLPSLALGGSLALAAGTGTQLSETVETIKKATEWHFNKAKADFVKHSGLVLKGPSEGDQKALRALQQNLEESISVNDAIGKIYNIYAKRYQGEPQAAGLLSLKNAFDAQSANLALLQNRYTQFTNLIQKRAEDPSLLTQSILSPQPLAEISDDQAAASLTAYCQKWCPNILPAEAEGMIARGKEICDTLMNHAFESNAAKLTPEQALQTASLNLPKVSSSYPARSLENATAIIWHLMSQAIKKQQGFEEGAFILEDSHYRVYEYLKGFEESYARSSSHFKGRSPEPQMGLDVFDGKLPASKRTILFGSIDNLGTNDLPQKILFIKPENYSADLTQPYDAVMHGYEFVEAQYAKKMHPGSDDLPSMRKERVPAAELAAFAKLIDSLASAGVADILPAILKTGELAPLVDDASVENVKKMASQYGLAFMHRFLESVDRYENEGNLIPANFNPEALKAMLANYDHVEKRTGREVYLDSL